MSRLGFNLVRSVAVAFAIRQLRLREAYSAAARAEIEAIWRDSLEVASIAYVVARHCTGINPDEALLAGLLHVLGRLYIVMRAEDIAGSANVEAVRAAIGWQGEVGRIILASWGLPAALQHAVAHQDDLDRDATDVSVTDVLIAAKYLAAATRRDPATMAEDVRGSAVFERMFRGRDPMSILNDHAEDLRALTSSLE